MEIQLQIRVKKLYIGKKGVKEVRNAKPIAEYQKEITDPYLKGLKKIICETFQRRIYH